jgi:Polysaccharide pyruvyl transferase
MLYYCKTPNGNFGDDLNPWLWPRLAPEVCAPDDDRLFVGIGTILTHKIPSKPFKAVFGSGCWSSGPSFKMDARWKIYCVRGPLTAARLKLDPTLAVVDPAILIRQFSSQLAGPKKHRVSFMPHLQSISYADWHELCARIGFDFIDPTSGVETILKELQETELLLAEAMHGAIVADALRVPWIPVRMYGKFASFKWQDWAQSIHVPLQINNAPPIYTTPPKGWKRWDYRVKKSLAYAGLGQDNWKRLGTRSSTSDEIQRSLETLKKISEAQPSFLSDETFLSQLETRLLEKLAGLRADWKKSSTEWQR